MFCTSQVCIATAHGHNIFLLYLCRYKTVKNQLLTNGSYQAEIWWVGSRHQVDTNGTLYRGQTGLCSTHESWVKFDSTLTNESSQSRVGRENQGPESSQSRITLIVTWVRVESTEYGWVKVESLIFLGRKRRDIVFVSTLQGKNQPTATFNRTPPPPPPVSNFCPNQVKCDESWVKFDSTLTQMSWVGVESGKQISDLSWFGVESVKKC